MIKEFKKFPSGSSGYNSREIETEEDDVQLMKEIDEELLK
jgi:hypothetical protein